MATISLASFFGGPRSLRYSTHATAKYVCVGLSGDRPGPVVCELPIAGDEAGRRLRTSDRNGQQSRIGRVSEA